MKRYPVGIQSFSEMIEEGYAYVDKTRFIGKLVKEGKYYFLSRPRRFGKSLLLSTMHAYFAGMRTLFKGLRLDNMDVDWSPSPVLRFDFNSENYKAYDGLERLLDSYLRDYEELYGRHPEDVTPAQRFRSLIRAAYRQTGKKVVVLVDEYDKPLLEIEDNKEIFDHNQMILKAFFGNLKTMDEYIRFAFISGVARFNKVSIFSDLNNLDDISLDSRYSDICGLTEKELLDNFSNGIKVLAERRKEDFDSTLRALRNYYDGYLFSEEGNRLYNPFSVLLAFRKERIGHYWFDTGTPTFLVNRVKRSGIDPASLNGWICTVSDLTGIDPGLDNPVPIMYQTGYLTIESYDFRRQRYTLCFPNEEVEVGFRMICMMANRKHICSDKG